MRRRAGGSGLTTHNPRPRRRICETPYKSVLSHLPRARELEDEGLYGRCRARTGANGVPLNKPIGSRGLRVPSAVVLRLPSSARTASR